MAITAARSELNINLVGDDQTQAMLDAANKRIEDMTARVQKLTEATRQQQQASEGSSGALGSMNRALKDAGDKSKGLVSGLGAVKEAAGKFAGALGFAGVAIAGVIELGGALIEVFDSTGREVRKLTEDLEDARKAGEAFSKSMAEMSASIAAAQISTHSLSGSTAQLRGMLAKLRGDAIGVEFERRNAEIAAALEKTEELEGKIAQTYAARGQALDQERAAAKELARIEKQRSEEEAIKARLNDMRLDAKLRGKQVDSETYNLLYLQRQEMQAQRKEAERALADARSRQGALERQVEALAEQRNLMREIASAIETAPIDPNLGQAAPAKDRPRRGVAAPDRAVESESERLRREAREEQEALKKRAQWNREFTAQVLADAQMREERLAAKAREREEAEEKFIELAKQADELRRKNLAAPWLDFSKALSENLGPALNMVSAAMQDVNKYFEQFQEGQIGFQQALEGSAHAVARMVAEQVGGVRAAAAVDAAYHLYKGFGTAFTNPAESAGHFVAAAGLTAVAAGAIPTGAPSAKASPAQRQERRPEEPRADTGNRPIVYNIQAGVMDGQSVAAAIRRSERSSRGTGYAGQGV